MNWFAAAMRGFWIAPLAAAALLWASFPPLDLGFLAPVAWAVLFLSLRLRGGERAGRQALLGQFVFFMAGLWWISPLVSVGWAFVALWCAVIEAFFARCLRPSLRAARDRGAWSWVVIAPLLHLGFDMIRTTLATGFPWLLTGYTGWRNPILIGSADLIGVHGATLAIVALGAALAEVVARRIEASERTTAPAPSGRLRAPWVPAAALWCVLTVWAVVGFVRSHHLRPEPPRPGRAPTFHVLVLQASIPQELKNDRDADGHAPPTLEQWWKIHEDCAAAGFAELPNRRDLQGGLDLVIWPETMVPSRAVAPVIEGRPFLAVESDPATGRWRIGEGTARRVAAASRGAWTLAGIITEDRTGRQRNSAILMDGEGRSVAVQDKQHLTPGGETMLFLDWLPEGLRGQIEAQLKEFAGFVPALVAGAGPRLLPVRNRDGEIRVGVLICYESIFPEIPRAMVREGADVIVNVSNYGWFTGTPEMEQALAMAAFRAAELRRPLVLASNNGISAVIGPDGGVADRTAADERTQLLASVPLGSGSTPFSLFGEWAAWVLGGLGAVLALVSRRRTLAEAPKSS